MEIPVLTNFDEYLIYKDGEAKKSEYLKKLDGHNDKKFVLCESKYLKEFFDEIKNNPHSSYVTYLNDFIRENYDGENLPIKKVSCLKKQSEDNIIEDIVSRLANALQIPTSYLKYIAKVDKIEFNEKLNELIANVVSINSINITSDEYLLSIDFIGKNEYFDNLNDYARYPIYCDICERNSTLKEYFAVFDHERLFNPLTNEELTHDQKMKLFREFIPQYFFRTYVVRDWDLNSENVGIIYNEKTNEYHLSPMFDFENSYSLPSNINIETLQEDMIFAYDGFPKETDDFFKSIKHFDIDNFLHGIKFEGLRDEDVTADLSKDQVCAAFKKFASIASHMEYTKDFIE